MNTESLNERVLQSHMVTAKELADHLRLSVKTVRRLAREGRFPSRRFGRSVRFDLAAVIEAGTTEIERRSDTA